MSGRGAETDRFKLWSRATLRRVLALAEGLRIAEGVVTEEKEYLETLVDSSGMVPLPTALAGHRAVLSSLDQLGPLGGSLLEEFAEVVPEYLEEVQSDGS
jgi:hypothetical protein